MAPPQTSFTLKLDTAYMEVPFCRTCKRWEKDMTHRDRGHCTLAYENDSKMSPDDHHGGIHTSGNFGCVEWEAR